MNYNISPGYLQAAGTTLLAGRDLTLHDDKKAPKVALVNRTVCGQGFRIGEKAIGGHFKFWGGNRAEVVGVVEDGKYRTLTEDQQPAMFFSFQQQQSSGTWLLVRSQRDPQEIAAALDEHAARPGCGIAAQHRDLEPGDGFGVICGARGHGGAGRARAARRDAGGDGNLRHGLLYREQAPARTGDSHGARRAAEAGAARGAGTGVCAAGGGLGGRYGLGVLATKVLSFIVYQAAPKDPVVLGGVVLTMLLLGLVAAWIPAQRALAVNPMILMREE